MLGLWHSDYKLDGTIKDGILLLPPNTPLPPSLQQHGNPNMRNAVQHGKHQNSSNNAILSAPKSPMMSFTAGL